MKCKTLSALLLSTLLLGACGNNGNDQKQADNNQPKQEQKVQDKESSSDIELNKPVTIDKFEITVKKLEKVTDMDGHPCLLVTYDFTNNSDKTTSSDVELYFQGFQDGVETSEEGGYVEDQNENSQVDKGATSPDNQQAVVISDENKPLEVRITPSFGDDLNEKHILKIDDLNNL